LAEKVISQITFEIEQIDQLMVAYADLWERAQQGVPDLIEMTAMASVLHSFYNGVENIFLSIAKGLDQEVPAGAQWHRDLLVQMTQKTASRERVISTELARQLTEFLGFRHFYRHSYSFFLEWGELEKLVAALPAVWDQARKEISEFRDKMTFPS
jgi:hypothetical protein